MISAISAVDICFIILVGLPGTGKTSLANFIKKCFSSESGQNCMKLNVIHICYDKLISKQYFNLNNTEPECGELRNVRQEILGMVAKVVCKLKNLRSNCCEGALSFDISRDPSNRYIKNAFKCANVSLRNPTAIVIDDNMYYSSMRYSYFQLARCHNIGFCQIYLDSTLATTISINSQRKETERLPDAVIQRMAEKLEVPLMKSWEHHSLILPSSASFDSCKVVQQLENLISESLLNPVERFEKSSQDRDVSSQENMTSMVHQADLALRLIVREHIEHLQANMANVGDIKKRAQVYANARRGIIDALRSKKLVVPEELCAAIQSNHPSSRELIITFLLPLLPLN